MATYRQGSQGDDVKRLQQTLIDKGYDVGTAGADGIYGTQTAAAVKRYQQAQGLTADGIAGQQTQDSLWGGGTQAGVSQTQSATGQRMTGTSAGTSAQLGRLEQGYKPSDTVIAAQQYLQQVQQAQPGAYQSPYDDQIQAAYEAIVNRKPFAYALDEDALWGQYLDQYQQSGQMAMQDTMAQAAALTGGYGSTYGQAVGQQAYNAHIQQAADIVPELYNMAADRYAQEGDELYKGYQMLQDREADAYGKWRDEMGDYYDRLSAATSAYTDAYNRDYDEYMDQLAYWQDREQAESADYWARYDASQPRYSGGGGPSAKAKTENPYVDETMLEDAQEILSTQGEDALDKWLSLQRDTYGTLNDSQIDTLLAALTFPLQGAVQPYNPGDLQNYLNARSKKPSAGGGTAVQRRTMTTK